MGNAKKVVSLRLEDWLVEDVERLARANGLSASHFMRQLIHQGIGGHNILEEYITTEGEKTEKSLKRIEAVVCGLLHALVVKSDADRPKFMSVIRKGIDVAAQFEAKAPELAHPETTTTIKGE